MIVLVSFIFLESSEWRKFTTELALAGFLSFRASLGVYKYIFTIDENRESIITWIVLRTICEYREYDFMTMKIVDFELLFREESIKK